MTLYQRFKKLDPDLSGLGFYRPGEARVYWCTPQGARIIGRAGVDGIHYCFVRGYGETVFAVIPMDTPGRNVCPIAGSFEDLLRLLLAVGDMAALDQAWYWDREQFDEFLADNPPGAENRPVLDLLRDKLGVTPMPDPYGYLQKLWDTVDMGPMAFSDEYYEALEAARQEPPREWRVTLTGGFFPTQGKSGREVPLNRTFQWGQETWHVPALYLCSDGAVVDFLIEIDPERYLDFYRRVKPLADRGLTEEERLRFTGENPLHVDFHAEIQLNDVSVRSDRAVGDAWFPPELLEEGAREDLRAKWVLDHYDMDLGKPYVIRRCSFPLSGARDLDVKSLTLRLERREADIPALSFPTPKPGEAVVINHPLTGERYTLTVLELRAETIDMSRVNSGDMEYPTHLTSMTYTLEPDLPNFAFSLRDRDRGDSPRQKNLSPDGPTVMFCSALGVIGRGETEPGLHAVCSALHFEPQSQPPQWQFLFREKLLEDLEVKLI